MPYGLIYFCDFDTCFEDSYNQIEKLKIKKLTNYKRQFSGDLKLSQYFLYIAVRE